MIGGIMTSPYITTFLLLELVNITFYDKRYFADMIKLGSCDKEIILSYTVDP